MRKSKFKHFDFQLIDISCFIVSYLLIINIRFSGLGYDETLYKYLFVLCILIELVLSSLIQPYKNILKRGKIVELVETFKYDVLSFTITIVVLYAAHISTDVSRLFIFTCYFIYFLISYTFRLIYKAILLKYFNSAIINGNKSLIIITKHSNLKNLIDKIKTKNFNCYKINSIYLLDRKNNISDLDVKIIGNDIDVVSYICHDWVDEVYIDVSYEEIPLDLISKLSTAGINISIKLGKIDELEGREQHIDKLFDETVLNSQIHYRSNSEKFLKRMIDIIGGIIGITFMIIIMLIIGPIIYIKSPGPIFYKQKRVGTNGKIFNMYKFRSMVINADDLKCSLQSNNKIKDGMMFKMDNDPRIISGIGEFIRKTSIDEFPQFINVLIGNMSLVGTRPPTLDEWEKYNLEHRIRMSIKPGITGIWQTSGRSKITDFDKVVEMDREYINNWSLALDIKILFKTIICLFSKREDAM